MKITRLTALAFVLPALACEITEAPVLESPEEPCVLLPATGVAATDILFVVDNSCSMADEQENLALNFEKFIEQLGPEGDYQVAVITTDQSNGSSGLETSGEAVFEHATEPPYNLLGFDTSACTSIDLEHGCFRGPDPLKRVVTSAMSRAEQRAQFADNIKVGTCGWGDEQGFAAVINALDRAGPGGCNEGFIREDANLLVIFVGDEDDTSERTADEYLLDLGRFKPYDKIRVATIVGTVQGVASDCNPVDGRVCGSLCQTEPSAGSGTACNPQGAPSCPTGEYCDNATQACESEAGRFWNADNCGSCNFYAAEDCCSAQAGTRYVDFAFAAERAISNASEHMVASNCRARPDAQIACLVDSICNEDFGPTLAKIALELILPTSFELIPRTSRPDEVTLFIRGGRYETEPRELINGVDFRVSADGATLSLITADRAQPGEELAVFFAEAACGPTSIAN